MLLKYLRDLWYCLPLLMLILFFCVGHAYRVNARRSIDDPNKRDFHLGSVILAPISWPVLLILSVGLLLLRAVVSAVLLLAVTFALVVIRKPFLIAWLEKVSTKIGNIVLELNTTLIYAFLGKDPKKPPS